MSQEVPVNRLTTQRNEPDPTTFLTPGEGPNFSQRQDRDERLSHGDTCQNVTKLSFCSSNPDLQGWGQCGHKGRWGLTPIMKKLDNLEMV